MTPLKLNFNIKHVTTIYKFKQLRIFLPIKVLKVIYTALVEFILNYKINI